jgi:acyl-ACP thioesterase
MTMIFRLLRMYIYACIGSRCRVTEETLLHYRCWFTDLDINWHMTNTRYSSFMDLVGGRLFREKQNIVRFRIS